MIPNPSNDPLRRLHSPLVPEIKAEIGGALKAARLKKGQSLEAVGQQTRISKRFLEALEENRFDEFPALAYLRGFLKSYCDYLELDFEAYWRAIQSETPGEKPKETGKTEQPKAAAPVQAKGTQPGGHIAHAAPAHHAGHAAPHAPSPQTHADPAAAWRAVFFGAVLASAVGIIVARGGHTGKSETEAVTAPPALLQPMHQAVEPRLVVEFRQEAWLSVSADGQPRFEGRAPRNTRQEWSATKVLTLRTPSPEALQFTFNGKHYALPPPDASGAYVIESP